MRALRLSACVSNRKIRSTGAPALTGRPSARGPYTTACSGEARNFELKLPPTSGEITRNRTSQLTFRLSMESNWRQTALCLNLGVALDEDKLAFCRRAGWQRNRAA